MNARNHINQDKINHGELIVDTERGQRDLHWLNARRPRRSLSRISDARQRVRFPTLTRYRNEEKSECYI